MSQADQSRPESQSGRSIELEVEVPGTPEEVWRAIATGPGISSWYVPHEVEEMAGGAATASFGPEPEMQVPGRVAAWNPPQRVLFDGGEGVDGLAFEWLIEARDGSCVVRLVNSGFGNGGEWDDHYDAMTEGWKMFLANLRLHLEHFPGESASASLPMGHWPVAPGDAWERLRESFGLSPHPEPGAQISVTIPDSRNGMTLSGTVVEATPTRLSLLLDKPAPGTAFIAAEPRGDGGSEMSMWSYLYGPGRQDLADRWHRVASTWFAATADKIVEMSN